MTPLLLSLLLRAMPVPTPAPEPWLTPATTWATGDKHKDGGHKNDDEEREEDFALSAPAP